MKKKYLPSYSAPETASIPTLETIRRFEPSSIQKDNLLSLGNDLRRNFECLLWTAKHADSDEVREKAGEMVALIVARIVRHGGNIKATLQTEVYELHRRNSGYKKKWHECGRQGMRQESPQNKALREFLLDVLDIVLPDNFISTGADLLLADKPARKGAPTLDERLLKFMEWVELKASQLKELRGRYRRAKCENSRWSIRSQTISEIRAVCVLNLDDFFEVFITPLGKKMFSSNETHPLLNNFQLAKNLVFKTARPPMPWSKNVNVMKRLLKELL
jgi:hypothetical protein